MTKAELKKQESIASDEKSQAENVEKNSKKKLSWSEKTRGEKAYEVIQFIFGKVFIIAVTAVIAFKVHPEYAPDRLFGGRMPNYLKKAQAWADNKVLHNKIFPMGEKGPFLKRMGLIISSTFLLSHGGNTFAPFIHWLENAKESISQFFNKLIGKPGELEKAHERLKDEPKQTWGDTIKGRAIAFVSGFVAAAGVDVLINAVVGKHKSGMYYLDAYSEWFGRWLSGFTKKGKELGIKVPITQELNKAQDALKVYRFGKLAALDLYITSATLILWTAVSRFLARKRHAEKHSPQAPAPQEVPAAANPETLTQEIPERQFTETIQPRRVAAQDPGALHADKLTAHRQNEPVQVGV